MPRKAAERTTTVFARIAAIAHRAEEGGYWAEVPCLPGCFTQAETIEELERNLQVAVDLYVEDLPERLAAGPIGVPDRVAIREAPRVARRKSS